MYMMSMKVPFSQVDEDGNMTLDAIVDALQDCTMFHCDSIGRSVVDLSGESGYWYIASWQIQIIRAPKAFEVITVTTNPYDFKGFFGSRCYEMLSASGEQLVRANSTWVYLDSKTHAPARIPAEEGMRYGEPAPPVQMDFEPRKIKLPAEEEMTEHAPVLVRYCQLDTNRHVNNCEYIRTAMDVTGIYGLPKQLRVEYKLAAKEGDVFYPYIYRNDEKCVVDLRGEGKTDYATVEVIF